MYNLLIINLLFIVSDERDEQRIVASKDDCLVFIVLFQEFTPKVFFLDIIGFGFVGLPQLWKFINKSLSLAFAYF